MNKKDAKQLLKNSGKTKEQIKQIYDKHTDINKIGYSEEAWNKAINLAFYEAAGLPCHFAIKGNTINAVAELLDQE